MALKNISPEEARKLIDDGALVIDFRKASSYERAHLPGAIHVLPRDIGKIEPKNGGAVIFYCCDGDTSPESLTLLESACPQGHMLQGGINQWMKLGFPVENGSEAQRCECSQSGEGCCNSKDSVSIDRCGLIGLGTAILLGALLSRRCKLFATLPVLGSFGILYAAVTGACPITRCIRCHCRKNG